MLAALGGKWMGTARVRAVLEHSSRAASIRGCNRAGGRAAGLHGRGSLHPGAWVPSHDMWAGCCNRTPGARHLVTITVTGMSLQEFEAVSIVSMVQTGAS